MLSANAVGSSDETLIVADSVFRHDEEEESQSRRYAVQREIEGGSFHVLCDGEGVGSKSSIPQHCRGDAEVGLFHLFFSVLIAEEGDDCHHDHGCGEEGDSPREQSGHVGLCSRFTVAHAAQCERGTVGKSEADEFLGEENNQSVDECEK